LPEKQKTWLPSFSEIVGMFNGLVIEGEFTHVKIDDDVLSFQNETQEAAFLKQFLTDNIVGKKIGILRTDNPDKPILIRMIDQKRSSKN